MAQIKCFHCNHEWDLGTTTTNRCPECGWIVEIYYSRDEAEEVAKIYNETATNLAHSGVRPLIGINGYAVAFPDQGHLSEIADRLLLKSQR
jgi:predicted RNA-binding Zn-ribbon protein involved in translation (DUF1610 family)